MEQQKTIAMVEEVKKREFHHLDDDVLDSSFSPFSEISRGSSLESSSSFSSPSSDDLAAEPLGDMSSLLRQLPIKRGLSKYYEGKSQSFASLTNVRSLEDLAKSQNRHNKKLKYCRSYEEGFLMAETQKVKRGPNAFSRPILKKGTLKSSNSKKLFSSLTAKRVSASGFRLPIPPQRSTNSINNISKQSALFA